MCSYLLENFELLCCDVRLMVYNSQWSCKLLHEEMSRSDNKIWNSKQSVIPENCESSLQSS